ncbi:putative quinol monooxygenase [Paracidobacterium acidisoli]|uniref:Antibiotic biosynthesis monooxygenase n=1 Tax=Paracidobacterium acidisoli TaxID=2303751 RepID=A0A372ILW6_9BACT|nr:putative quinol monooxygenase [Paracidobacterium acidisoli]MBT9332383.1 antibiotic biosynthesis monooxygenase [Paracidobacterium acidisoli]
MDHAVVLDVHMEAVPGRELELEKALLALVAPTREEPGCLTYLLHRNQEHSGRFLFYEKFRDQAALEAHLATSHFQKFAALRAAGNDPVAVVTVTKWNVVE